MAKRERLPEYYAEEQFNDYRQFGRVYTGPLFFAGVVAILGAFGMSAACRKSRNMQFLWLQRRSGCQFYTFAYLMTTNLLYEHDGQRWKLRDMDRVYKQVFGRLVYDFKRRFGQN